MGSTYILQSWLTVFVLSLSLGASAAASGRDAKLRYEWESGKKFAYDIEITVDTQDRIITYKGVTRYTVNAVDDDQYRVTYRGGLNESSKAKNTSRRGRPGFGPGFGPFGPRGRPSFPDPFARPTFAGKSQTTNRITITQRGQVLAMEGDSHLPYLLGNVSLLPFEGLPEGNKRQWVVDSGISITQEEENSRFGRFGPFSQNDRRSIQAGGEATRYAIVDEDAEFTTVKKTYQLSTPKTAEQPAFSMTGEGTWKFDRRQHLPDSLAFDQQLIVDEGNSQHTIPITTKYRLMTAEEVARIDADAQRRIDEMKRAQAEKRQTAEAPLTAGEKRDALAALRSGDATKVLATLTQLRAKSPKDPDPEIAAAIESLLADRNPKVQEDARGTLVKWSPDFKRKVDLNSAYNRRHPVASTDRYVSGATPLYIGQIVQAQEHGSFWFPAEILDLLADGKVMLRMRGAGRRDVTLTRRNIQLAPDEVDQPNKPAGPAPPSPRLWTDASGTYQVEATFLGMNGNQVKLKKTGGKEIEVPLDKLSQADQQYVKTVPAAPKVANPFE